MPIYAYQCSACGHEMEALQKMSDAPLTECPSCHASALTKKVTAAAFRLGGGGWYETDFKSGNKKNLAGNDAPSSACGTGACPASKTD
ncbi:zinc ribbon domain-containing protein [Thiothrix litoralis]|jgi:putative FmdB family regulatory protein|uniref:Zinc ribbon domain-containing protein n=1 Tax=Thiothrix litoralis TaxID=2891210 RepID=A0ABX7WUX8_9GAMM|nr:zinc ribbon domain-containing protein [Thiothrix litoralis]QTR47362.1 zinc ribbon domain-containing protein [Thiothrix litoralis]